jgi:hypothetical protein
MRRLVRAVLLARPLILVAAALSCPTAFAEKALAAAGTTLLTLPGPGAPEPTVTVWRMHEVTPNAGVDFDAKAITVVLYGKKIRFTGGRCASAEDTRAPYETWAGRPQQPGGVGGNLTIVRHTDTGKISGSIRMPTGDGANLQIEMGGEVSSLGKPASPIVIENRFLPRTRNGETTPKALVAAAKRDAEEDRRKLANAVPLITPGPPLPANNPAEQSLKRGNPRFVKLHSIVLNNAAFGADVVTAVVDGKEHRFVGSIWPTSSASLLTWRGYERESNPACQSQGFITLQKHADGVIDGFVSLPPNRQLRISTPHSSPPSFGSSVQLIEVLEP